MWDLVRDARFEPDRFLAMVARNMPSESDEQIASFVLNRSVRAATAYRTAPSPALEQLFAAMADDRTRSFGIRKASADALIGIAATPQGLQHLGDWLDGDSLAGAPLKEPTRWAIVTQLLAKIPAEAQARFDDEAKRDPGTEGKRRAFIAQAAVPDAKAKRDHFMRYLSDTTLNEEWVTASLRAFNDPQESALTQPLLTAALDTLPWIQTHRRIFFLGQWLGAFLDGQTSPESLREVDQFLSAHPSLPTDLRQKILQAEDELRRTVRIRAAQNVLR
jgi:aminopeptidase N